MHVVLWDTKEQAVSQDFVSGFGVAQHPEKTPLPRVYSTGKHAEFIIMVLL